MHPEKCARSLGAFRINNIDKMEVTTMVNRSDKMLRSFNLDKRLSSKANGDKRLADTTRICAVDGCGKRPDGYSRYCSQHKYKLRDQGHPTLDLSIKTQKQYQAAIKIGEWMRWALTNSPEDRRAWMRVEDAIERIKLDRRLHLDKITMARRDKHFTNMFKAKVVIAAKLDKVDARHILAGYLGMAATIFALNEVSMNTKQLLHCTHKAGGRIVTRYARTVTRDECGKTYKWKPSYGVLTRIGEFIEGEIAREFGSGWWRDAQSKAAVQFGGKQDGEAA